MAIYTIVIYAVDSSINYYGIPKSNAIYEMKAFTSSGVFLILFAAGIVDLSFPLKSLALPHSYCVRALMEKGDTALKSDFICGCYIGNLSRFDDDGDVTARYCYEKYNAQRVPQMSPSQRGGTVDICSGPNAALVRASGLDWCDPTIRVEPVRRHEWQQF